MSLRAILPRCSSGALLNALAGIDPDMVPVDESGFLDFAHGMEASITLFPRQVNAGMITRAHLGIPEDVDLPAVEGRESDLRDAVLRAVFETAAASFARKSDRSDDIVPEPVDTVSRVFLVGDLGFYGGPLSEFGNLDFQTFTDSSFPLVIAPCQRGGAFGFSAQLRSREEIGNDIDLLIMGALREAEAGYAASIDTLLFHDGVDYRALLSFADDDERQRLAALADARTRGYLATDGELRRSFRYRALRRSLVDRIEARIEEPGYGRFTRNVLGDAVSWHYSTDCQRALATSLLPLLGDRRAHVPAWFSAVVSRLTIIAPWDAASPQVVLVPETCMPGDLHDPLPGANDLVVSRVADRSGELGWSSTAAECFCVEHVQDLDFLKPVFLEGMPLEEFMESLK